MEEYLETFIRKYATVIANNEEEAKERCILKHKFTPVEVVDYGINKNNKHIWVCYESKTVISLDDEEN